MHGITFPRFVFFTLIHSRGSTLFPIFYLLVVCGSTVSLFLSLSLERATEDTQTLVLFSLACSLKSSPLSLVHPIRAKNTMVCCEESFGGGRSKKGKNHPCHPKKKKAAQKTLLSLHNKYSNQTQPA
jgi:hypothetical protein